MLILSSAKKIVEKLTGTKIYRNTTLPFGLDPLYDIEYLIGYNKLNVIFDVGANVGQSAKIFAARFPEAKIYCFEPSLKTFDILKDNLKGNKNIIFNKLALATKKAEMKMIAQELSDRNKIIKTTDELKMIENSRIELIQTDTLDGFCGNYKIGHINYLKIDTEGYDLEVLKSGRDMLKHGAIDFVEAETGMNPTNHLHVPFEEIKKFMEENGYYLFGIYEQVQEWKGRKPFLRRSNSLFICKNLADISN